MHPNDPLIGLYRRLERLGQRAETASLLLGMARVQLAHQCREIEDAKRHTLLLIHGPDQGPEPGKG